MFFTTGFGIITRHFLRQDLLIGSALTKRMANIDIGYTAEEIDALLKSGKLERLGMGSRRACYRLPGVGLCVKCYRSDEEIAEGKHPGRQPFKPLSPSVVKEIRRCRFDKRCNTCCQEYKYWTVLNDRLPEHLMSVFPSTMELMLLPSRGWCVVEELIKNEDGTRPLTVHDILLKPSFAGQTEVESMFRELANGLASHAVRLYDPNNVMIQHDAGSVRLRLADFEPASRSLIPIDALFPFLVGMKVRRRMRRFLSFASSYRSHLTQERDDTDCVAAERIFAVRNHAGKLLVAWTDCFLKMDPTLAAKVIPISLETAHMYEEDVSLKEIRRLIRATKGGECAWIFYPAKADDVRTVFFERGGELFVKKTVAKRSWRFGGRRFAQRELPPVPIFKGESVAQRLQTPALRKDYSRVETELMAFFDELLRQYPPVGTDVLPACTFDAIPQNCIVDSAGRYNFFDLEYDMEGGVPLAYLIFRAVCSTVVRLEKEKHMGYDYWKTMRHVASHYGVTIDKDECFRINAAVKRFNTISAKRLLTNAWLSMIPVRAWRLRFCWWSTTPKIKGERK